ncbi:MAG: oxygen-independent coproporphyrinogen III oxidase [Myxococcota bacterium]
MTPTQHRAGTVDGDIEVTPELLLRYDRPTPRYTSYPTADRFGDLDHVDMAAALARANAAWEVPLSLYVHLPFCGSMCGYCGCNVVITQKLDKKRRYMDRLLEELFLAVARLPDRRRLAQVHLGGGTPNSYPVSELKRLLDSVRHHFELEPDAEVAIEIDPRASSVEEIHALREIGFNRVSMGIQDFDPKVQEAVGRVQPYEMTEPLVTAAREAGFDSVNVDLIYGLPHQSREGFAKTVEQVLTLAPDRIATFSFAYVPWMKPHQAKLDGDAMPAPEDKLALFCDARATFIREGYTAIGLDHFARSDDPLTVALAEGRLRRNFQGYTVLESPDVLGIGMSSISNIGGAYAQNHKKLHDWHADIWSGHLPVARGHVLSPDDRLRRALIEDVMCRFRLDREEIEERHGVDIMSDFPEEMARLRALEEEGLVVVEDDRITCTPVGRLFVRIVASTLDPALHGARRTRPAYSQAV